MTIKVIKSDDGFWLALEGNKCALIHLESNGDIVTAALEEAVKQSTEDPEPQADDVETIRALEAVTKAKQKLSDLCSGKERWHMSIPADETNDPDIVIMDGLHLAEAALTRLSSSAPIDVQIKAEAVVDAFDADYAPLNAMQKQELSRLIVEQFALKG